MNNINEVTVRTMEKLETLERNINSFFDGNAESGVTCLHCSEKDHLGTNRCPAYVGGSAFRCPETIREIVHIMCNPERIVS